MTIEILTFYLVLFTGVLVLCTFASVVVSISNYMSNDRVIKNNNRPFIRITPTYSDKGGLYLCVENIGKSMAYNLKLKVDDNIIVTAKGKKLADETLFKNGSSCFYPGTNISFILGVFKDIVPFRIEVKYEDYSKVKYNEVFTIDFNDFRDAVFYVDNNESLKNVADKVNNLTTGIIKLEKSINKSIDSCMETI